MAISPYNNNHENYNLFKRYSIDVNTIAFTGAGTSVIPGIPMWKKFLMELNRTVNANVDIEPLLTGDALLDAASRIYNALDTPQDFYDGIAEVIMNNQRANFHDLHIAIWTAFKRVITTNYDDCFERAILLYNAPLIKRGLPADTFQFQQLPNLNFDQFEVSEKSLAYIHGKAGSHNLILRKEDYQKYYPSFHKDVGPALSYNLEEFLKKAVGKYSFVFIGFSLEDEDLVRAFETYREQLKELHKENPAMLTEFSNRNHFIFLLNDDLKDWINIADILNADLSVDKLMKGDILKYMEGDPERLVFRRNFKNSFDKGEFSPEERLKILGLYELIEKHKRKLERLKKLNVLDIRMTGSDFRSISDLLVQISTIEDSADEIGMNAI